MTTDHDRLAPHRRLDAVLGPEEAATLMRSLPVTASSGLAIKDDLRALDRDQLRTTMLANATLLLAVVSVLVAARP